MQILNVLTGKNANSRWRNHVAIRMWRGYEEALKLYHNLSIDTWINRNKNNTMIKYDIGKVIYPKWLNDKRLTTSHRCNLFRKDFNYYVKHFGKKYDIDAPYWWPVPLITKAKQKIMMEYWKHEKNN